ncbi:MAG: methyltransferase [Acholeplasmatales bacterium]|jgi:16S rRNA (guanine1207-N2)-methyltransferase|nr:methyltransferase [Acholeplasmatales bacterium]
MKNSHYFINDSSLSSQKKRLDVSILGASFVFHTDLGIFSKDRIDQGTLVLLKSLKIEENKSILDMGCGYGVIGVYLKKLYPNCKVTMVDVVDRALALAKENSIVNNIKDVEIINSNFFEKLNENKFDYIISNPPIRIGKIKLFEFYASAKNHLNENGKFVIVVRKDQGALSHIKNLENIYKIINVLDKDYGYWVIESCI